MEVFNSIFNKINVFGKKTDLTQDEINELIYIFKVYCKKEDLDPNREPYNTYFDDLRVRQLLKDKKK